MKATSTRIRYPFVNATAELYLNDCIEGVRRFPDESISIIVTSPPYNLGIQYSGYKDNLPRKEYLAWMERWAEEMRRILAKDGSLFLNIGGSCRDPLIPMQVLSVVSNVFKMQNLIHWIKAISIDAENSAKIRFNTETISLGHYKPINSKKFINDCHEYVGHFTHTGELPIDRLAIGVPYMDKSNIRRWKKTGEGIRCRGNTWFIPYETIVSRDRDRPHPASFPSRLAEMCIRMHGLNRVRNVMDPFMGIGSTAVACVKLQVNFIGFEIDSIYFNEAKKRIDEAIQRN